MSKLIRGSLGIIVILPGTYLTFFTIGMLYSLLLNFVVEGPPVGFFFHHRQLFGKLFLIALVSTAGVVLASMVHIGVSNQLNAEAKGIWLLVLLMGNILVLPVYWYFNIWRPSSASFAAPTNAGEKQRFFR